MKTLRGALVGVGKIAQTAHLPAFLDDRLAARAVIVAAADPDASSRRLAAERFPDLHMHESLDRLLREEEDIDFVDICSPPATHGRIMETAILHSKHILCEKPFAVSREEAVRLAGLLHEVHGEIVFLPCHQYRFSPLWRQFRDSVAAFDDDQGCLLQFNVFRTGADPGFAPDGAAWRLDRTLSGGGIIADTGVHYLYLCLWILGLPQDITARVYSMAVAGHTTVEDTAAVILGYGNRMAEITLTWAAGRRANSARLTSRAGSLVYSEEGLVRYAGDVCERVTVPDASDKTQYVSLYVSLIEEFLGKVDARTGSGPDIDQALQSVQMLHACYASADAGATVRMDWQS